MSGKGPPPEWDRDLLALDDDAFSDIVFPGWRDIAGEPPEPRCACPMPTRTRLELMLDGRWVGRCYRCSRVRTLYGTPR